MTDAILQTANRNTADQAATVPVNVIGKERGEFFCKIRITPAELDFLESRNNDLDVSDLILGHIARHGGIRESVHAAMATA